MTDEKTLNRNDSRNQTYKTNEMGPRQLPGTLVFRGSSVNKTIDCLFLAYYNCSANGHIGAGRIGSANTVQEVLDHGNVGWQRTQGKAVLRL